MDLRQKMHMIGFSPEFQQGAPPVRQDLAEGALERVEKFRREGLSPILCDENNVQLERVCGL